MRTYLDCIPCFYRQAIETSRLAGLNEKRIKKIIDKTARLIASNGLELTPPEMAGFINKIIKKELQDEDFYKPMKEKSNILALSVYDLCKNKVKKSNDSLLTAVEMAIAGNIIDFGVKNSLNIKEEIDKIIKKENQIIKNKDNRFFAYKEFKDHLSKSKEIIYLADNAGETVFDRILIEEIKLFKSDIKITYAVKEKPIINDALMEDAIQCEIDKVADVISSGSKIPGTLLGLCSEDFIKKIKSSDMIISKGQGNFESFEYPEKPVFYLFMAKCSVVAKEVNCDIGHINLFSNLKK